MKEVVIGFLGCGNVGGGVWSLLTGFSREIAHRDSLSIRIKRVLVRDVNKTRACEGGGQKKRKKSFHKRYFKW
jgi:homoserine dehydrogenase